MQEAVPSAGPRSGERFCKLENSGRRDGSSGFMVVLRLRKIAFRAENFLDDLTEDMPD